MEDKVCTTLNQSPVPALCPLSLNPSNLHDNICKTSIFQGETKQSLCLKDPISIVHRILQISIPAPNLKEGTVHFLCKY